MAGYEEESGHGDEPGIEDQPGPEDEPGLEDTQSKTTKQPRQADAETTLFQGYPSPQTDGVDIDHECPSQETALTSANLDALRDATQVPPHQVQDWQISLDFCDLGSEYPASSTPDEDGSTISSTLELELWSPPSCDSDSASSSFIANTPEPQPDKAGQVWAAGSAQRQSCNIELPLSHGTIIDEATGLPTPAQDVFPIIPRIRDDFSIIPRVRDDFRVDWKLPPDASGNPQSVKAAPPWVPDPLDDSEDQQPFMIGDLVKGSERERGARTARVRRRVQGREQTLQKTQRHDDSMASKPELIFKLPAELRLKIYRELLVADAPIVVHGGWHLVYRRTTTRQQQQGEGGVRVGRGLYIAILRVHPLFCAEGLGVLYGENTFLYRLRDPAPTMTDVSRLAYDDEKHDEDECCDDDDGDYTPEGRVENDDDDESASDCDEDPRAERGDGGRKRTRRDIYVEKYRHLFRHIVVEAEPNRFSEATMRAMARAIRTFAPGRRPAANIQTLAVRVTPLRVTRDGTGPGDADPEQAAEFTFVDFLAPDSPVLEAIRAIECHFLRVELMTRHMDGPSERDGCCLTIYRRPEMVARRYFADRCHASRRPSCWLSDKVSRRERKIKARSVQRALQNLGASVRHFCRSYVNKIVGGWYAFDDVDDDP